MRYVFVVSAYASSWAIFGTSLTQAEAQDVNLLTETTTACPDRPGERNSVDRPLPLTEHIFHRVPSGGVGITLTIGISGLAIQRSETLRHLAFPLVPLE